LDIITVLLAQELLIVLELIDVEEAKEILAIIGVSSVMVQEIVLLHGDWNATVTRGIQTEDKTIQQKELAQIILVAQEDIVNIRTIQIIA